MRKIWKFQENKHTPGYFKWDRFESWKGGVCTQTFKKKPWWIAQVLEFFYYKEAGLLSSDK